MMQDENFCVNNSLMLLVPNDLSPLFFFWSARVFYLLLVDATPSVTFRNILLCISMQVGEDEDEHPVMPGRTIHSSQVLAEACKFVYNDAKFVNERARNDIVLLSR